MFDPTFTMSIWGVCRGINPLVLRINPNADVEILRLPCEEIPLVARRLMGECVCDEEAERYSLAVIRSMQKVWLVNNPDQNDKAFVDNEWLRRFLEGYIQKVRSKMKVITALSHLQARNLSGSEPSYHEWAKIFDGTERLTLKGLKDCSTFEQLTAAICAGHRLSILEHIKLLDQLIQCDNVLPSLRLQLCRMLGTLDHVEVISILAKASTTQYFRSVALDELGLALSVLLEQDLVGFEHAIASSATYLDRLRHGDFNSITRTSKEAYRVALESIVSSNVQKFSNQRRSCAARLLATMNCIGSSPKILDFYESIEPIDRKQCLKALIKLGSQFARCDTLASEQFLTRLVNLLERTQSALVADFLKSVGNANAIKLMEQAILNPSRPDWNLSMYIENLSDIGTADSIEILKSAFPLLPKSCKEIIDEAIYSIRRRLRVEQTASR